HSSALSSLGTFRERLGNASMTDMGSLPVDGIARGVPKLVGVAAGTVVATLLVRGLFSSATDASVRPSASMRAWTTLSRSWSVKLNNVSPASSKTDSPLGPETASILVLAVSNQKGAWSRLNANDPFSAWPLESFQE